MGRDYQDYQSDVNRASGADWTLVNDDCIEGIARDMVDESVDLSVYSPPFASLYTYSATERDLGNCRTSAEFFEHYAFLIRELFRVTRSGRVTCVHVAQIAAMLERDGYIGMKDFRGDVIRAYLEAGWIYHGEVCIDKDPQAQAIRTKAKGLLFVQMQKDSAWSRPAMADYILIFRKPGANAAPVQHAADNPLAALSNDEWISWARPIWYGIRESDTLQTAEARDDEDERHICLAAGSLVLTRARGYIAIEDVAVGDLVLTHKGRWKPVTAKRCNGEQETARVCAQGVADLRVTPDHKLWTRRACGDRAKKTAALATPTWVKAEDTLGSYLNLKLPPVEENALTEDEWWIVGRWLGDGHRGGHKRSGKRGGLGQFLVSCSHNEAPALIARLGKHAGHAASVTATQIALKDLRPCVRDVLNRCGVGATGKRLPGEAVALSPEKSEALLSGYLSADGHYVKRYDRICASSVSRALLLGMAIVAQRARGVVPSVYAGRPARRGTIQGRDVNMAADWTFAFRASIGYRQSGWIGDDGAWKKVRKIEPANTVEVWDIAVADDASFTAEGAIVKNCPLQLGTIERCVRLYSNPGDVVLSPFAGIGSEGYVSLQWGRRFVGYELKPSYFRVAERNLRAAESMRTQGYLFGEQPA
jgi:DNA modification methylase